MFLPCIIIVDHVKHHIYTDLFYFIASLIIHYLTLTHCTSKTSFLFHVVFYCSLVLLESIWFEFYSSWESFSTRINRDSSSLLSIELLSSVMQIHRCFTFKLIIYYYLFLSDCCYICVINDFVPIDHVDRTYVS